MINFTAFLSSLGPWALAVMAIFIVIETGLLFPFLPGDSLVFTVGLLSAVAGIPLWLVIVVAAAAAITGDQIGFEIGRRQGRKLFKPDARIFKTRYLDEADQFFARWGRGAIVLARFVPVVRTFIAPAIGASTMRHRVFTTWNAVGGILWASLVAIGGFYLGKIPVVANNVELFTAGIVVISVVPIVIGALARRRRKLASQSSTPSP